MRMYEILLLLHPEITDERISAIVGRMEGLISGAGGKVTEIDQWGVRKLAYKVRKQPKGYYTLVKCAAPTAILTELERTLKLTEDCLRFMTVNLEQEVEAAQLATIERVHKKPSQAPEETESAEEFYEPEAPAEAPAEEPAAEAAGEKPAPAPSEQAAAPSEPAPAPAEKAPDAPEGVEKKEEEK